MSALDTAIAIFGVGLGNSHLRVFRNNYKNDFWSNIFVTRASVARYSLMSVNLLVVGFYGLHLSVGCEICQNNVSWLKSVITEGKSVLILGYIVRVYECVCLKFGFIVYLHQVYTYILVLLLDHNPEFSFVYFFHFIFFRRTKLVCKSTYSTGSYCVKSNP